MVLKMSYVVITHGHDGGDDENDCNLMHLLKCFKIAYWVYDRKILNLPCLLIHLLLLERVPPRDGVASYPMDCSSYR
jgi:hypothetical protein